MKNRKRKRNDERKTTIIKGCAVKRLNRESVNETTIKMLKTSGRKRKRNDERKTTIIKGCAVKRLDNEKPKEYNFIMTSKITKINKDRALGVQELGWLFRPLAICPFPAQSPGTRKIINEVQDTIDKEYRNLWTRKSGDIEVEILSHPKYGVPYGQDTLIILFLAIEAKRQNSRTIKVNFFKDFMKLFQIDSKSGSKYIAVRDSLRRIENSKYSWRRTTEEEPGRVRTAHYSYIDKLNIYCSPSRPDQKPMFDQFIQLSEAFWNEIQKHQIPFNLEAIRFLQRKPAYLNYYIWLSMRTGQLFKAMIEAKKESVEIFVPYWGNNGLQLQMCTSITNHRAFRQQVKKWQAQTLELWPRCPTKIVDDGLKITLSNINQLDVMPDMAKLNSKFEDVREIVAGPVCPKCSEALELRVGKKINDGMKLDDYYRCTPCKTNYYKNYNPELFPMG
ncbi:MAG: hypothetical protein GY757_09980 [bacterium]|nr:hypothetical protein [bacterium]